MSPASALATGCLLFLILLPIHHFFLYFFHPQEDQTPLHIASRLGKTDIVQLLLHKSFFFQNGLTPLHVAAHYDNQEVALLLLDKGASPHATAKQGVSPLHLAAQEGHAEMASLLLGKGAHVNTATKVTQIHTVLNTGLTPLHLAAQEDRVSAAEVLAKHDANLDQQTKVQTHACTHKHAAQKQDVIKWHRRVNEQEFACVNYVSVAVCALL
uniref:Uncharacterized protein n=1 Tax=Stegastes partitus TaxID=144197 RepID=A0A3B5B5E0_9TELE